MKPERQRADLTLVARGFAESRQKAQALILAGQVLVAEQKIDKPGQLINVEAEIRILGQLPFVSRAGSKLLAALKHFNFSVTGRICADLGASTGGFTDCLLQHGALQVHTYDVGNGLLDWKLRADPRVVVHDQYNVRHLAADDLPGNLSLITVDLSFISLTKILEPLRNALRARMSRDDPERRPAHMDIILLVKPQFEVGKGEVGKGGIVRDPKKHIAAVETIRTFAENCSFRFVGQLPSPLTGAKGNQEFLLYLRMETELICPT